MNRSGQPVQMFFGLCLLAIVILASGCLSNGIPKDSSRISDEGPLTFYTEQLPPYNFIENGTLQGISVDCLQEISNRSGIRVSKDTIRLVPWTEGYQATLNRENTVLFTTVRLPEREKSFKWAGPVYPYTNVLFSRVDRNISISSPEMLSKYRIGVLTDDIAAHQLLSLGVPRSTMVFETNATRILTRLENGDIDLWGYNEEAGRYFIRKAYGNESGFVIAYTLPGQQGYYAFHRNTSDATVESFQRALDQIKNESSGSGSVYDRIVRSYVT